MPTEVTNLEAVRHSLTAATTGGQAWAMKQHGAHQESSLLREAATLQEQEAKASPWSKQLLECLHLGRVLTRLPHPACLLTGLLSSLV